MMCVARLAVVGRWPGRLLSLPRNSSRSGVNGRDREEPLGRSSQGDPVVQRRGRAPGGGDALGLVMLTAPRPSARRTLSGSPRRPVRAGWPPGQRTIRSPSRSVVAPPQHCPTSRQRASLAALLGGGRADGSPLGTDRAGMTATFNCQSTRAPNDRPSRPATGSRGVRFLADPGTTSALDT